MERRSPRETSPSGEKWGLSAAPSECRTGTLNCVRVQLSNGSNAEVAGHFGDVQGCVCPLVRKVICMLGMPDRTETHQSEQLGFAETNGLARASGSNRRSALPRNPRSHTTAASERFNTHPPTSHSATVAPRTHCPHQQPLSTGAMHAVAAKQRTAHACCQF